MGDIVEIVRVLVYRGPRDVLESTLAKGAVPMNGTVTHGNLTITSKMLTDFPMHVEGPK